LRRIEGKTGFTSKTLYEESITNFKTHLERGYPENFIKTTLSVVAFEESSPPTKTKTKQKNLALCNAISPSSA